MAKKRRRQFTEEDLIKLEAYSAIRLPMDQMADLLNTCRTELGYAYKRDDRVRRAIDVGRSKASNNVRKTLFQMAVGRENVPPDFQALKFWCQTQEGFKTTGALELSGPDDGPIAMTTEELKARVIHARRVNDLTEDE